MATYGKTSDYKCKMWIPTGRMVDVVLNGQVKLTTNFCVWEMANKLAEEEVKLVIPELGWRHLQLQQRLRDRYYGKYKTGLTVSSGYRTKSFNKSVGGSTNSAHLDMCATDFIGIPQSRYKFVRDAWFDICGEVGAIGGINYYADNRIHVCSYENKFGNKKFKERDYR